MPTAIKICGLSNDRTLKTAVDCGADYVGLVHFPKSPRHVTLPSALRLAQSVPESTRVVLLVVNPDRDLLCKIRDDFGHIIVQLHGHESPEDISLWRDETHIEFWKALPAMTARSLDKAAPYTGCVSRILFDTPPPKGADLPGGNGAIGNWPVFEGFTPEYDWGLAGGLSPDNVVDAIKATGAPLVDVSSGVEDDAGVKNVDKISAFCQAVKSYGGISH